MTAPPTSDTSASDTNTSDTRTGGTSAAGTSARRGGAGSPWLWVLMGMVILATVVIGTRPDTTPRTNEERSQALADGLKCPTCRSQSVADSDAPVSKEIRAEITRRVESGETDAEIRAYLTGRFGDDVVLTPAATGVTGLVWVLPVVVLVVAGAALALAFRRWRERPTVAVTDDDRELVERTRKVRDEGDPS